MKRLIIFALLTASAFAACTGSNPNWSATLDLASVQVCVNNAATGSTITVASGSVTWASSLNISGKRLTIVGAGIGSSNVTSGTPLNISATATNFVDVSGFTFSGGNNSNGAIQVDGTMFDVAFRLHHLRLVTTSNRGIFINHVFGLIDHVTIDQTGSGCQSLTFQGSNDGQQEMTTPWTHALSLGTNQAVYVEDSTVNFTCGNDSLIDSYGGARWVFRHNVANINTGGEGFGGGHGTDSGDRWGGPISFEVYANTINNTGPGTQRAGTVRGGTGVWFNNTYTGSIGGLTLMLYRACTTLVAGTHWSQCNGTGYRVRSGAPSNFWDTTTNAKSGSNCGSDGSGSNCAFCSGNKEIRCSADATCTAASAGTCTSNFDGAGSGGYPCRNQPGIAPGQVVDPIYVWLNGSHTAGTYNGGTDDCGPPGGLDSVYMVSGRDYVNNGSTAKPGYTSFTYPHPLQGGGGAPAVQLTPASLSFANQIVGTSSASQALTLTNVGTATLNIASISITGTNAGDFSQSGTCGSTLAASLSCTMNVIFAPTAIGARAASVSIADDASGSPHTAGLTGTGTGIAPIVSLVPPSLSFSNQAIGTSSPTQVITMTNTGDASLTLASIVATGDYSRTTTCGASLAIGANCTITVTFTPTATGTRTGAITIIDNAPGSPHVAGLTGTAFNPGVVIFGSGVELSGGMTLTVAPSVLLPNMGIAPASLAFGSIALGNISTLPLVVTNTGTAQLNIIGILVADSTNYSQTNNCTTLAPAVTCTINVTFAPQSAATLNSTLTITANDAGSPHVINLSGTGAAVSGDLPLPTFSPTVLSLPNVFVNPMAPFSQIIQQTIFIGNSTCPTAPARTNYKGQAKGATVCDYIDADGTGNQTVMTDWCSAADQRWDVVWTHGSSFNSGSSPWTWCDKYNGAQTTQFIVFHSDTPNPRGRMVCSHGLQDVLTPPLPDPGQRNHGCAGFLGMPDTTAPTPITNAAYTFDASYNDLANMITLTSTATASGGTVIAMGAASTLGSTFSDCGVSGTGVCPTDGVNHIVVQDARIMPASSITTSIVVASTKTPGWFGGANVLPAHDIAAATHDVGFDEDYFTADGDDDGFGNNSITGLMQLACRSCWFNHNYLDGDKRDGSENHALNLSDSPGPVMVVHNYIEGASIGLWGGGGAPPAVSGLITTNVERRRNKVTYLGRWLPTPAGMQSIKKTVSGGSCSGGNTLVLNIPNTGANVISNLVVYLRTITGVGSITSQWYAATSVTATAVTLTTACTNGAVGGGSVYGFASNVVVTSAAAMNAKAVKDPIDNNPVAKNRSENKEGLRTVIDGEVMENCGADGQAGFCLLISVRNSSGTPGSEIFQISDFVVTNTILRHGNQAIQISPRSGNVNYVNWPITNIACAGDGNSAAITATGMNNGLAILQSTQAVYGQDIYLTGIGNGAGSGLPLLSTGFYATQYPTNGNYGNDSVVTVLGTGICPASDTTTTGTAYGPGSFNGGGVTLPGHRYVFQNVLAYDFGNHSKWDGGGATTLLQNGAGGNNFTVGLAVTQVSPVVIVNAVDLAISSCPISQICPKVLQASTGDLAYVQCPNDSRFSSGAPGAEGVPMLSVAGDQLSFTYTPQNGSPALAIGNTATCSIKAPDSSVDSGYYNNQSFPWPFYWNHNTAVGVNNFVIAPGGGSFVKSATFQNSLQLVPGATEIAPANVVTGGGFRCNNSDKYSATDTTGVTFCNDRSSLTYQRYVMSTRSIANNPNFLAGVICGSVPCSQDPAVNPNTNSVPGMVSSPGAIVTCGGVACDATHFLPDSVGFLGSMNTTTFPLNLPDFRNYVLHPSSPYRAGGILQASDAKDQGVQMSQLINAQNRTLYVCGLPCGAGPFRDGPQYGFLVWTASSDPALINYRIYRDGGVSPIATVTTTYYTDYGLSAGAHTWVTKAWNGTVESSVNGLTSTTY